MTPLCDDFDEVAVGVAQQCAAVTATRVMRGLNYGSSRGCQQFEGLVDVVGPHNQDHCRAAGRGVNSVHPLRRLYGAESNTKSI